MQSSKGSMKEIREDNNRHDEKDDDEGEMMMMMICVMGRKEQTLVKMSDEQDSTILEEAGFHASTERTGLLDEIENAAGIKD